jgi:catechol 2,3-dioxygenase-like lactoylglutathione lyase family enzyme
MITGLGSVPIFVSDQDRTLAFFCDKLGFEVVLDRQYGPEFRWVAVARQAGATEIVLFRPVPSFLGEEEFKDLSTRIGTWTGIVFLTTDIQADYDTLVARGVEFRTRPTRQGWGGMEAIFSDPDGNFFHLVQRPKRD